MYFIYNACSTFYIFSGKKINICLNYIFQRNVFVYVSNFNKNDLAKIICPEIQTQAGFQKILGTKYKFQLKKPEVKQKNYSKMYEIIFAHIVFLKI